MRKISNPNYPLLQTSYLRTFYSKIKTNENGSLKFNGRFFQFNIVVNRQMVLSYSAAPNIIFYRMNIILAVILGLNMSTADIEGEYIHICQILR